MVSQRGLEVLRAIVQDYVSSREPVGSKAIVDRHQFGVSAATIRNDMALLEEEELIVAPHTSSGRVPTDKGYRLFVDHLAEVKHISPGQKQAIDRFLDESVDFDELLGRTVRLLSQLTNQVAIVQYPTLGATRVRHVELVALGNRRALCIVITDNGRVEQRLLDLDSDLSEEELSDLRASINAQVSGKLLTELSSSVGLLTATVGSSLVSATQHIAEALTDSIQANRQQKLVMAGTANLVRTEDDFQGSIYPVLDAIEEQVILLKLLTEMKADAREVAVSIGHEHSNSGLEQTSLLAMGYTSSGESATLGLLGPTRMDYSNNIASVRAVARYLTRVLDAH
ncbi:heat-inducible transcriptional repressor [Aurantimicrobium minutum]|uniref:heat-inducible transcriptional repressor HrcA n=1 Tax=Aurantimicrobium minutum TaxID=708131 RepID=UPI00247702D4|nr:heat-inducible transcriptional repressor HrcA [Aurantimicrobium minutum]MDH6532889.1 heat-inducible transcriptional repressor [Aurantimicrobium minutum]